MELTPSLLRLDDLDLGLFARDRLSLSVVMGSFVPATGDWLDSTELETLNAGVDGCASGGGVC